MLKRSSKKVSVLSGSALKDLVVIGVIMITVFIFSYFFNIFIFIVDWFKKYPHLITFIDEIISLLITLSIGFAIFSWRRLCELKRETMVRIKYQKELVRIAETKAEIEGIISKQLHGEIEVRKKLDKGTSF